MASGSLDYSPLGTGEDRASDSAVSKNSPSVIPNPSHNFLMAIGSGFLLSPSKRLFTVACGTPDIYPIMEDFSRCEDGHIKILYKNFAM